MHKCIPQKVFINSASKSNITVSFFLFSKSVLCRDSNYAFISVSYSLIPYSAVRWVDLSPYTTKRIFLIWNKWRIVQINKFKCVPFSIKLSKIVKCLYNGLSIGLSYTHYSCVFIGILIGLPLIFFFN